MAAQELATPSLTLVEVKEQFKKWRRTRKSPHPIPPRLLEAAVSLANNYSFRQISDELLIDREDLKKNRSPKKKDGKKAPPAGFIELGCSPPVSECIVEMEDGCGAKMRMHFRGKTDFDLLELGKAFWRERP